MTDEEMYQKCPVQYQALIELNDELNSVLHAQQLRSDVVDTKTVVGWLRLLHNLVQDGLQHPRYSFAKDDQYYEGGGAGNAEIVYLKKRVGRVAGGAVSRCGSFLRTGASGNKIEWNFGLEGL